MEDFAPDEAWPARFEGFFQSFIKSFKARVAAAREDISDEAWLLPAPQLWKINGDTLLFSEFVYPDHGQRDVALLTSLRAFIEVIHEFDESYLREGLGVRGCVWTAGFPFRNKLVCVVQGNIELMAAEGAETLPEAHREAGRAPTVADYIGRDMDLGFRLSDWSAPRRVACSLDSAHFLMALPVREGLSIWHVGWRVIKGVFAGQPYPILWLESSDPPTPRNPWDTAEGDHATDELRQLFSPTAKPLHDSDFRSLEQRVRDLSAGQLIVPYASPEEMPREHRREYDETADASTRTLATEPVSELDRDDYAVPNGQVETITLDDLNQLQLFLQEHPDNAPQLRGLLREVAEHSSYVAWEAETQFESMLFRLHRSLAFATDPQRRMLESMLLVKDDVLRVKINLRGAQVFITDGLWVPASIRVFPFADESDLVLRACEDMGWAEWATCVVDPAAGCGHNMLRYPGSEVRRYGFDRNARALGYARVNAALNGVTDAVSATWNVEDGIPPVFTQREDERVLVLANMPFALVPNPNTIARSADGGRHGYKLTHAALDAAQALSGSLTEGGDLRCVVLAYSIGNVADDDWVVPRYAADRFGQDNVSWRIWNDEKLWRVNGRKEQDNPMPLDRLELKAECRFHVRDDANRNSVRTGYRGLTAELLELGYDHLAYGVVIVDSQRSL